MRREVDEKMNRVLNEMISSVTSQSYRQVKSHLWELNAWSYDMTPYFARLNKVSYLRIKHGIEMTLSEFD